MDIPRSLNLVIILESLSNLKFRLSGGKTCVSIESSVRIDESMSNIVSELNEAIKPVITKHLDFLKNELKEEVNK